MITFYKFTAAGNDFIIIDNRKKVIKNNFDYIARKFCDRKFGIGSDGLILIENSPNYPFKMKFYNPDGTSAKMCGNGARCIARLANILKIVPEKFSFETDAGIVTAEIFKKSVKVKLFTPKDLKENIKIRIENKTINVSFINTGVPHAVIFVKNIEKVNVREIGRKIRFHKFFMPEGTNVNFVKINNKNTISVRTYERGVEDETLACGTGVTASAIISVLKNKVKSPVSIITRSKIVFKVYIEIDNFKNINNVYLEGPADLVFTGNISI